MFERLTRFFKGSARQSTAYECVPEIAIRQNSPPDERDVDEAEQYSDEDSKAPRSPLVKDKSEPRKSKSCANKAGGNTQ